MISKEKAIENIRQTCQERLNSIYCAGIPDFVSQRYEREMTALEASDTVLQFEAYRVVSQAARRMSIPMITSSGTFLSYLLGYMGVNPLPAHYYCTECGQHECEDNYNALGIDLSEKECSCGHKFISMGIGIPFECVWGEERQQETQDLTIRAGTSLVPFAEKALRDLFGDERVIKYGIKGRKQDGTPNIYWIMGGFAILPDDISRADLEDEICWLENGEECIDSNYTIQHNVMRMSLVPVKMLDILYECQNRTGIFASDIPLQELSEFTCKSLINLGKVFGESVVCDIVKQDTKREICRTLSASHSTLETIKKGEHFAESIKSFLESDMFKRYPFIEREDFFTYLTGNGVSAEDAITANELFRRGRSAEKEFVEALEKYNFPEDFYETVKQYKYLFPRFHNAAYLYIYLLLAKYSKLDRKMYMSVLNKFSQTSN